MASAGFGYVFWVLAARLHAPPVVGAYATLIWSLMFVSGLSQLGLTGGLARFLPVSAGSAQRLVLLAYGIGTLISIVGSTIFIAGIRVWCPAVAFISNSLGWQVGFVLGTMGWTLFSLQDAVLTGLRRAVWLPVENTAYAIVKVLVLLSCAEINLSSGLFISWVVPAWLAVLLVTWLIFARLLREPVDVVNRSNVVSDRTLIRYTVGNYGGTLFSVTTTSLLPILVANLAGPSAAAYFAFAWLTTIALTTVAQSMMTSVVVEGALRPDELDRCARDVLLHVVRLIVPVVLVLVVATPIILRPFGQDYVAQTSWTLRWLAMGTLPSAVVTMALSVARVRNQPAMIAAVQGTSAVLLFGLTLLLLPGRGIAAVGFAWLTSQVVTATALSATYLRPLMVIRARAR
jgi:O-antigen/teichoic acid export membrane protein